MAGKSPLIIYLSRDLNEKRVGGAMQISGGRVQLAEKIVITIILHHPCLDWVKNPRWWEPSTLGPEGDNCGNKWLVPFLYFPSLPLTQQNGFLLLQLNHTGGLGRSEVISVNYRLSQQPFGNNYLPPQNHASTHVLTESDRHWHPPCCSSQNHGHHLPSFPESWFVIKILWEVPSLKSVHLLPSLLPLHKNCHCHCWSRLLPWTPSWFPVLLSVPPVIYYLQASWGDVSKQKSKPKFQWLCITPGKILYCLEHSILQSD